MNPFDKPISMDDRKPHRRSLNTLLPISMATGSMILDLLDQMEDEIVNELKGKRIINQEAKIGCVRQVMRRIDPNEIILQVTTRKKYRT